MRIQHNISALNSYHKLATNNSNLAKNLEKLSSGYKINRAADDAAGLAISEKMRAQITGLETAQQNSKDGISLVQTAEGALTEVHSMLNRMVALTTQASNGIYEDGERTKIQDELDQLCEEIDRIADATNFNGIKLLDGTMTSNPTVTKTETAGSAMGIPTTGTTQNTNTIVHKQGVPEAIKTKFSVDLGDFRINGAGDGDKLEVALGDLTIDLEVDDAGAAGDATKSKITIEQAGDTAKLASAIKDRLDVLSAATAAAGTPGTGTAGEILINGQTFTYTVNTAENEIQFEQKTAPADASEVVDANMGITTTFTSGGAGGTAGATFTTAPSTGVAGSIVPGINGTTTAKFELDFTGASVTLPTDGQQGASITLTCGPVSFDIDDLSTADANGDGTLDADELAAAAVAAGSITVQDDGGADVTFNVTAGGTTSKALFEADADTYTIGAAKLPAATDTITITANVGTIGGGGSTAGHINTRTTVQQQGAAAAPGEYANTNFAVTAADFSDGSKLKIGDTTYVFSADGSATAGAGEKVVDMTGVDLTDVDACAQKLTDAAVDNTMFTVGYNGGKIEITETKANADAFDAGTGGADLTTKEKIEAQLGKSSTTTTAATGKGLRLQIGDTDDTFNMLDVNVQDCHAAAIGVGKSVMRVDDVDTANKAMMAAKSAIETVSATRSKMGAIQNRLDHTLNNLAETTTNLTDAESRIRDTDMAEEMMKYTKNNILIQASQAMLAQANQVPQGVLQLLQ